MGAPYDWSLYPALIDAFQNRDWLAMTTLYQQGAPATARFPQAMGEERLNGQDHAPKDGFDNLPMAFISSHVKMSHNGVFDHPLMVDSWRNGLAPEENLAPIETMFRAWGKAGGQWDEPGPLLVKNGDIDPIIARSVTAFVAAWMPSNDQKGAYNLYTFESDFQEWTFEFMKWGWKPGDYNGEPLVHHAARMGYLTFLEKVAHHEGSAVQRRNALDETPLHVLRMERSTSYWTHDSLQDWLREQPLNHWQDKDAEGLIPLERWLLNGEWTLVDEGVKLACERQQPLRIAQHVLAEVAQRRLYDEAADLQNETLVLVEGYVLRSTMTTVDKPASASRPRTRL